MTSEVKEYYVQKGRARGKYVKSDKIVPGRKCSGCRKKYNSFPDGCNDGWPCGRKDWQESQAETCINYVAEKGKE